MYLKHLPVSDKINGQTKISICGTVMFNVLIHRFPLVLTLFAASCIHIVSDHFFLQNAAVLFVGHMSVVRNILQNMCEDELRNAFGIILSLSHLYVFLLFVFMYVILCLKVRKQICIYVLMLVIGIQ